MVKPGDFYVGVVDFFAILLPGAAVLYVLLPLLSPAIPPPWLPTSPAEEWGLFLGGAYVTGHFLHAFSGATLDPLYDHIYLPLFHPSHVAASQGTTRSNREELQAEGDLQEGDLLEGKRHRESSAPTLRGRVLLRAEADASGTSLYDWCLSAIRIRHPSGSSEIDRIQADSKFFRSMTLVFLTAVVVGTSQMNAGVAGSAGMLAAFSGWRFCRLRWAATKRVYAYYLLLDEAGGLSRGETGGD